MLKDRGAKYVKGKNWEPFVVQDGLLITGQNPTSAEVVAKKNNFHTIEINRAFSSNKSKSVGY